MYSSEEAQRTLKSRYMTPYHVQAQWAEFANLKRIIGEQYKKSGRPIRIFDIGVGTGRIPLLLSKVATWDKIAEYTGIDISEFCLALSNEVASARRMSGKFKVIFFDATKLATKAAEFLKSVRYDLAVCTYFTAGDFRPEQIKLDVNKDGSIVDYDARLLRPNRDFISVFKGAYDLLEDGGKIVIGSIYYDSDFVRKIQERFYEKCGMHVITTSKDEFTATRERFWSERFDTSKARSYLPWVSQNKIDLIDLDDYDFASMVLVSK
jgi:SAM-dependent methyltransferase